MEAEPCPMFTETVNFYENPRRFPTLQPLPFNVDPDHLTYEMLEAGRLRKLGAPARFSRRCNIVFNSQVAKENAAKQNMAKGSYPSIESLLRKAKRFSYSSLSPFFTYEKKTCGYFFSRDTDNRMTNFGIPASDVWAWRSTNKSEES